MTCKWKVFCEQGDTCVAHNGYDVLKCTAFKDKGVPMTNEEWLKSINTEQLAEWIFNDRVEQSDWWYEQQGHTKAEVLEWLKQPHTFE